MIKLYTDFKSPAAYLALKPTIALIQEYGLRPKWLPYNTRQVSIPAEKPNETKGETHVRVRATQQRETHLRYAGVQQVPMKFRDTPGETIAALAALLFIKEDPARFIETAFRAYWVEEADLNDTSTVLTLLTSTGYDAAGFDPSRYRDALDKVQQEAAELGVVDAPAFVIDEQVFIGREHFPWIRSLLDEREG